jgi:hypothetical protein
MPRKTLAFLAAVSCAAVCAAQGAPPLRPSASPAQSATPSASPGGSSAAMSGRVSGTLTCTKPDPMHRVDSTDWPGHFVTASRTPCTWTKPAEIAGDATKDGYSVGVSEVENTVATERGSHVTTMANGDRVYVLFRGKGMTNAAGAPQNSDGNWNFKGGSGKFAGLEGMGTYRGKANPDGTMSLAIEGSWRLQ